MASIKGISEDFPGAYSGQGRSWELKTKEAIELLPDKYGFQPKVVLSARAPPTITATAVDVPMHERAQYGSAYIAVSDGAGQITPRKLAASLNTPVTTQWPSQECEGQACPWSVCIGVWRERPVLASDKAHEWCSMVYKQTPAQKWLMGYSVDPMH